MLGLLSGQAAADKTLILAVHPYLPLSEIEKRFSPLINELSRATGQHVILRISQDNKDLIKKIGTNQVDIAFMEPASVLALERSHGSMPLIGQILIHGKPEMHGRFVVRQDSPIKTLDDLRDKRIAFVDPYSTMGHLVPRRVLHQAGVPDGALGATKFVGSDGNVAMAILCGEVDVGAMENTQFTEYESKGLRSLYDLPTTIEHIFVTAGHLPPTVIKTLRQTLLGLSGSESGRANLKALHPDITGIAPIQPSDLDALRQLLKNETGR